MSHPSPRRTVFRTVHCSGDTGPRDGQPLVWWRTPGPYSKVTGQASKCRFRSFSVAACRDPAKPGEINWRCSMWPLSVRISWLGLRPGCGLWNPQEGEGVLELIRLPIHFCRLFAPLRQVRKLSAVSNTAGNITHQSESIE